MMTDDVDVPALRRPKGPGGKEILIGSEGSLLDEDTLIDGNTLVDDVDRVERSLFDEVRELEMQFSSIMEDLEEVKKISDERKS